MAFDTKRLKAIKWLEKIAAKEQRNIGKAYTYNPYRHIYMRFGSLYATNGFILAQVDYPEFEHDGDDSWKIVSAYTNGSGNHLEMLEYDTNEQTEHMRDRLFADMFIGSSALHYDAQQPFNAYLIAECMYLFKLYDIAPVIWQEGAKIEFVGHNREVSIRVLMMGVNNGR